VSNGFLVFRFGALKPVQQLNLDPIFDDKGNADAHARCCYRRVGRPAEKMWHRDDSFALAQARKARKMFWTKKTSTWNKRPNHTSLRFFDRGVSALFPRHPYTYRSRGNVLQPGGKPPDFG
jgi:hypothetical protein